VTCRPTRDRRLSVECPIVGRFDMSFAQKPYIVVPVDTRHEMFEPFSSGYYLGRLYVEPHGGDRPAMHREQHEHVSEQLYAGAGTDGANEEPARQPERPEQPQRGGDQPLVMKIGGTHVPVHGAEGVPERTVALPEDWLEATRLRNPPTLTEVLLAKRERAEQLLHVEEETPTFGV